MNSYLDIIIRSTAVYFFMIIALRLFGKKELSQLNTADVGYFRATENENKNHLNNKL